MSAPFVETHCHLNHRDFAGDREDVIARARAAGVGEMVVIGYDLPSSEQAVALADPERGLFATAGVHPHDARHWAASAEARLRELLARPGVVALGEVGLDFYRDLSPRSDQYAAFRAQLDVAAELGLPAVIHTRDSMDEALEVLAPFAAAGGRGVLHCWSGTPAQARRALELGFSLGIGGVVTYAKPGDLPQVVFEAPLDRLLLETDCPYLAPVPHRGRRNEPAYVPLVAARVAEVKGVSVETVAGATTAAARGLFGLAEPAA